MDRRIELARTVERALDARGVDRLETWERFGGRPLRRVADLESDRAHLLANRVRAGEVLVAPGGVAFDEEAGDLCRKIGHGFG